MPYGQNMECGRAGPERGRGVADPPVSHRLRAQSPCASWSTERLPMLFCKLRRSPSQLRQGRGSWRTSWEWHILMGTVF